MVILAAAAITAATVGAYKGSQAAATDVSKRWRRHSATQARQTERSETAALKALQKEQEQSRQPNASVSDRVARFKQGTPTTEEKRKSFLRPKPAAPASSSFIRR